MLLVASMVLFAPTGDSLMTYHGPDDGMPFNGAWPESLKDLVRTDTRVLGVVGPIVDYRIYCAGETAELNAFLKLFANVPDARKTVVLHPGSVKTSYRRPAFGSDGKLSGYDEEVYDVDWALHVGDYATFRSDKAKFEGKKFLITLDIWLGGQIKLDKLDVPRSILVKSSGVMEKFINKHERERKEHDDNQE